MKKVSILIPCYNESESLEALYAALRELMDAKSDYQSTVWSSWMPTSNIHLMSSPTC